MKKILSIFLICIFAVSFLLAYHETYQEELDAMETLGEGVSKKFDIPGYTNFASPDEIYPILRQAAMETKVNVFRTSIDYNVDDEVQIHKYVLLTGNTRLFDPLRLKNGSWLTPENTQQGTAFISTANVEDPNQVGTVKSFGSHILFEVKPLHAAYAHLPVEGQYFVEASEEQYDAFVETFIRKLTDAKLVDPDHSLTPQQFEGQSHSSGEVEIKEDFLTYIRYLIFVVTILMLIYYIFNESKRIGIMKMHGLSGFWLWYCVIGRWIAVLFALTAAVSMAAALFIKDMTLPFMGRVIASQAISFVVILLISLLAHLYISRIKVIDVVKNRKETNGIVALNTLMKTGCSLFLILVVVSIWSQHRDLQTKQENLQGWERSKDYGVFYPLSVGNDEEDVKTGGHGMTVSQVTGLYPVLNKQGALYIDAGSYEQRALILNRNFEGVRSISVNPNYLREFPVYDDQNKPVQLSEETRDLVLLVPEQFRSKEQAILEYFTKNRKSLMDADTNLFKVKIPDHLKNQQVKIFWTANRQRVFSFNPDVFRLEHNLIADPIIQVITEQNSLVADKANMIGGGGSRDAMKVKLENRNSEQTFDALEPELTRLKLDDNLKSLISVDQYVLGQIYDLQKQWNQLVFISVGLAAAVLVLIIQNLSVFFSKYQRRFIIRRLFGAGFFKTYQEYMWLLASTWVIQVGFCFVMNRGLASGLLQKAGSIFAVASSIHQALGAPSIHVLAAGIGVTAAEMAASVLGLLVIERRNKLNVLKGGG